MFLYRGLVALALCDFKNDNLPNVEKLMQKKIDELKAKYGQQIMAFPKIYYQVKGNYYSLSFSIDNSRGTIPDVVSYLEKNLPNAKLVNTEKTTVNGIEILKYTFNDSSGYFTVTLLGPSNRFYLLEYTKKTELNDDYDRLSELYRIANLSKAPKPQNKPITQSSDRKVIEGDPVENLRKLGARVFQSQEGFYDWDYLAGTEEAKREISDTILLTLERPDIYDKITQVTRVKNEKNRPKAILFVRTARNRQDY
jgi:hypothetical protein